MYSCPTLYLSGGQFQSIFLAGSWPNNITLLVPLRAGNASLRHLGLQGNDGIGNAGVSAIGTAMEGNPGCALLSLDLSATGITVVGLKSLVDGASKLPGLHTVCLSDNNLAQEGAWYKNNSSI